MDVGDPEASMLPFNLWMMVLPVVIACPTPGLWIQGSSSSLIPTYPTGTLLPIRRQAERKGHHGRHEAGGCKPLRPALLPTPARNVMELVPSAKQSLVCDGL